MAPGRQPNGIGFLARRSVGRAKLLLSRIPAASVSSIPAAPQKRWQTLTTRTSVQRLGRSLARPGLHPSFHRISEKANAIGRQPAGKGRYNALQVPDALPLALTCTIFNHGWWHDPQRRLSLPAKLNLGKDPDGLAYRIDDGRVAWEADPVRMHADDAFAAELKPRNDSRQSERSGAMQWLREHMACQVMPANEVIEAGAQVGFTDRTLRRAYKAIGVPARKESFDGPWLWQLPANADQPPDTHDPTEPGLF